MIVNHEDALDSFPFKIPPFQHQRDALAKGWVRKAFAFFMEMGTGKSKTLLDNIGLLYHAGEIDFVVIIAPKGVYRNWVAKEIPEHLSDSVPHRVIRWVSSATQAQLKEMRSVAEPFDGLTIFVMNVETFSTDKGVASLRWLGRKFGAKGMIAVDESTTIKNESAKRTAALIQMAADWAYRRILTGSPIIKNPLDIFSQAAFLGPTYQLLGQHSFTAFKNRYAITKLGTRHTWITDMKAGTRRMTERKFKQVVGYNRLDELAEYIERFSFRKLKKDCLDLPPKIYTTRDIELTAEQRRMYAQIQKDFVTETENGSKVTVKAIISARMRAQQILSGHLKTDEGEIVTFPTNRLNAVMEIAEEASGKMIIWSRFVHDIEVIKESLVKEYGPESVVTYYGAVKDDDRQKAVESFQDPDSPVQFFVGNAATAGRGITLTLGTTVVYYANSYDLEHRIQSEDRSHRIGLTSSVLYIDLLAPGTVDDTIVNNLQNKIDINAAALGEEAQAWLGKR